MLTPQLVERHLHLTGAFSALTGLQQEVAQRSDVGHSALQPLL